MLFFYVLCLLAAKNLTQVFTCAPLRAVSHVLNSVEKHLLNIMCSKQTLYTKIASLCSSSAFHIDWARFTTSQGDFHYISSVSGDYGAFPWVIAEQFCQSLGGHLASIHTTEENDFVHSLFSSTAVAANEGQYWIGATRNRVDDSNRLPFTYTFTDGSGSIANLLNTANHSVFRTDEPDDLPCGVAAFADGNACQGQEGCIRWGEFLGRTFCFCPLGNLTVNTR